MGKSDIEKAQELLKAAEKSIAYFQQEYVDCLRHWENAREHMEELKRRKHEAEIYLANLGG